MVRHKVGDHVTVVPVATDPYILNFQRYGRVARQDYAGDFYVSLDSATPGAEFGPIPSERLAHGWRDENGRWR